MSYTTEQLSILIERWESELKQYSKSQQHWFNLEKLKTHLYSRGIPKKNLLNDIFVEICKDNNTAEILDQLDTNLEYQTQIITRVEQNIYDTTLKLIHVIQHILNQLKEHMNHKIFISKSILDMITDTYDKLFLNDVMIKITTIDGLLNGVLYKLLYQQTTNSTNFFIKRLTSIEMNLRLQIISSQNNKMVFIGKNGSGKSQFSRELLNPNNHNHITIIPAIKEIALYGIGDLHSFNEAQLKYSAISSEKKLFPTMHYNNRSHLDWALNYLLARSTDFDKEKDNNISNDLTDPMNKVETIFNKILENKKKLHLYNRDNKPKVEDIATGDKYDIENMSDGEKTILYLISCVILSNKNSIIIADEPEVHLHKSIQNKLWDELENYIDKQESIIIYITHDIDFMQSRENSSFYLFKSYNPKKQKLDLKFIENTSKIPDELFFELAPLTKPIIFCEGSTKRDQNLYEIIFPGVKIIECGSCDDVISRTKALNSDMSIKSKIYGLVDKDDRNKEEIEMLKRNRIYTIPVACVENLYLNINFIKALINTPVMISETIYENLHNKTGFLNEFEKQTVLDNYLQDMVNYFKKTHTADNYINYYMQKYTQKMSFINTKSPWYEKINNKINEIQDRYNENISIITTLNTLEAKYNKYLNICRHHNLSEISIFCGIKPNKKDKEFEGKLIRLLKTDSNFKESLNKVRDQLKKHVNCTEFNFLIDKQS